MGGFSFFFLLMFLFVVQLSRNCCSNVKVSLETKVPTSVDLFDLFQDFQYRTGNVVKFHNLFDSVISGLFIMSQL